MLKLSFFIRLRLVTTAKHESVNSQKKHSFLKVFAKVWGHTRGGEQDKLGLNTDY